MPTNRGSACLRIALALWLTVMAGPGAGAPGATSGHEGWKRTGDVLAVGLPAVAVATSWWTRGDHAGLAELASTLGGIYSIAEALKHGIHSTRPDGSDDRSFPSRHTALAFAAVRYLDRRYGYDADPWAPWLYAAAGLAGVAMVQADRHRWRDVIGGGALGWGVAQWATTPFGRSRVTLLPLPGGVAMSWQVRW